MENDIKKCFSCDEQLLAGSVLPFVPKFVPEDERSWLGVTQYTINSVEDSIKSVDKLLQENKASSERLKNKFDFANAQLTDEATYNQYYADLKVLIQKRKEYHYQLLLHKDKLELYLFHLQRIQHGHNKYEALRINGKINLKEPFCFDEIRRTVHETIAIELNPFTNKPIPHYYQRDYSNTREAYGELKFHGEATQLHFDVMNNQEEKIVEIGKSFVEIEKGVFRLRVDSNGTYEVWRTYNQNTVVYSFEAASLHSQLRLFCQLDHVYLDLYGFGQNNVFAAMYSDNRSNILSLFGLDKPYTKREIILGPHNGKPDLMSLVKNNKYLAVGTYTTPGLTIINLDKPDQRVMLFDECNGIKELRTTHDNCLAFIDNKFILRVGNLQGQVLFTWNLWINHSLENSTKRCLFIGTDNRIIVADYNKDIVHVI